MMRRIQIELRAAKQLLRHSRMNDPLERLRNHLTYEDVFIVSFPKSGNTWTRFLITGMQLWSKHGERARPNYYNIHTHVPDIHIERIGATRPEGHFPRIIKSHREYTPNYRRVVYVVRDVRDVMISRFHFLNRRGIVFAEFDDFLRHRVFGAGAWARHVDSWLNSPTAEQKRLMLVKYEDLLAAPVDELARMCAFMNVEMPREGLEWASRMASKDQVKELEAEYGRPRPAPVPFLRRGEAGQWKATMSEENLAYISHAAGAALQRCGYPACE